MGGGPLNPGLVSLAVVALLAAGAAGCHRMSEQERADRNLQACVAEAGDYLDPQWQPRQVVVPSAPEAQAGASAIITARGIRVTVTCRLTHNYYDNSTYLSGVSTIQGVSPTPGQLYLPEQRRWLTNDELHRRLTHRLAPRPGEYWGGHWTPPPPGDDADSELVTGAATLAGSPRIACLELRSHFEPLRQLVACRVSGGHRYWITQGQLSLELGALPLGTPSIPPA